MLEFIVECRVVNSNKEVVLDKDNPSAGAAVETFKVLIPEPKHDPEGIITSIAETQEAVKGLAETCAKVVCWKAARVYQMKHEKVLREKAEAERKERGVKTDAEREDEMVDAHAAAAAVLEAPDLSVVEPADPVE